MSIPIEKMRNVFTTMKIEQFLTQDHRIVNKTNKNGNKY